MGQVSSFVALYNRNPDTGKFDAPVVEVRGMDETIDLFSVGYVMPVWELYRKITFDKDDRFLYSV